jgi:chromosome segregation ATPase
MPNIPDRPNPIPAGATLAQALARIAQWEQWADDVEARFTRGLARLSDMQDRVEQRRVNMDQLSSQIQALQADAVIAATALTQMTTDRDDWKAKYLAIEGERNALLEELYQFRDHPPVTIP